jgi:rhodanese-related sulfurtransferase
MDSSLVAGAAFVAAFGWFVVRPMLGRISPEQARSLVKEGAELIDVRTRGEFAQGHVPGAVNIPLDEVLRAAERLAKGGKPVVLYCQSGMRSSSAARALRKAGVDARDLGAMSRWG